MEPDVGSSRRVLQFASSVAVERRGGNANPYDIGIDPWDILVGLLVADPGNSEPEQFFSHFGLVAGQALPDGFPDLQGDNLNRHLAGLTPITPPPTTEEAESIIIQATEMGSSSGDPDVAELSALWAALIEGTNPVADAISNLLAGRGVELSLVASETRGRVISSDFTVSYGDFLSEYTTSPVSVVNYKADTVQSDYVGISNEVDAFAYLLASRTLHPPLAVGLFGNWGSGKTFFMEAIRRRIDQITNDREVADKPQLEVPFWKRVVQIEFNAWHYVEGDLWSSLVEHIFSQLSLASDNKTDNVIEKRQRYLLDQFKDIAHAIDELKKEEKRLSVQLGAQQREVSRLQKEMDRKVEQLDETIASRVVDCLLKDKDVAGDVASVAKAVGTWKAEKDEEADGKLELDINSAFSMLDEARAELQRGRSLMRPLLNTKTAFLVTIPALVAVPLVVWGLSAVASSDVLPAFGGISSAAAALLGNLHSATRWSKARLHEIASARRKVEAQLADETKQWQGEIDGYKGEIHQLEVTLEQKRARESEFKNELAEVQRQMEMEPAEILNNFLSQVVSAGEYSKRLGVPALIRRNFGDLANLITHQNEALLQAPDANEKSAEYSAPDYLLLHQNGALLHAPDEKEKRRPEGLPILPEGDPRIINRIVLYIDDLDRCPDNKVIDVLQAVHLLLAFPLFVVVVAVDARWLTHALQTRYPALAGGRARNGQASPADYLEKIFQIPFWVEPLDDRGRKSILQGLLRGHVQAGDGETQENGEGEMAHVGEEEFIVLAEMVNPRSAPPLVAAEALTLTQDDLTFLDSLASILGETPRSIKRFVNVYQIMKILRYGHGRPLENPSYEYISAFWLAIAEGIPELASALMKLVRCKQENRTLSLALEDTKFNPYREYSNDRDRLKGWLEDRTGLTGTT